MYNNSSHYPAGYQSAYPQYQQNYDGSYGYQGYANQYTPQNTQPAPPGENFSSENWGTMQATATYETAKNDAVAQEVQQQKAQLIKQREEYVKKVSVLRHELEQLRLQKQELVGDGSTDRDLANILRENDKLQEEIQGKMKAIHNVIEMLSGIIKDGRTLTDLEASLGNSNIPNSPAVQSKFQDTSDQLRSQSPESNKTSIEKYSYVHYDTGLHWCWLCDEFPETAKDFLLHLQDKKHREMVKENDVDNTPWHKLPPEPIMPSDDNAPKKRIPIKGLQFFISAPSWYCKLCDVWIGDLHCASHHLKSKSHYQNYENFVVQNPHWEMEWLKDRERAKGRNGVQESSDSDSNKKKKKRKEKRLNDLFAIKEKKKKKRSKKRRKQVSESSSSSSSSDSSSEDDKADRSRSIRVAMRNMKQVQSIMDEDLSSKWNVLERLVEEHKKNEEKKEKEKEKEKIKEPEDPLINQWMTVSQPQEKDKRLLEDLKDRMKQKQEQEKSKQIELERKKREREREEKEILERQERAARAAEEEAERERKQKEQEELERIRNKDRNQVRFKTNYRRRRTPSRSDEEDTPHYDKHKRERYRNERSERSHEQESRSERSHEHDSRSERSHEYQNRSERSHEHENRPERSHERENRLERSYERESRPERSRERSKTRSRSPVERRSDESATKKKPPGPPSYKKLPFIGRMPLFKNRKNEDKEEKKEIQKESYEIPRRTRFQPGNLARAFIPRPDVVCFPKLSSIPPLTIPPPPAVSEPAVVAPEPPKIGKISLPKPPPPPKIAMKEEEDPNKMKAMNLSDDEMLYAGEGINPNMMGQYYANYNSMMYSQNYDYAQSEIAPPPDVPHSHTMPLEPPPLPPDDDLALLGICADDMAAQSF